MSATDPTSGQSTPDRREGFGRVLIAAYGVFALAATARSLVQLLTRGGEAPLAYGLSAVAGVVYIVATIALATRGRTAYRVSWVTIIIEFTGVIVVGTLSLAQPELFARDSVWSRFGAGYGFVPLVLPLLGMLWLRRSAA